MTRRSIAGRQARLLLLRGGGAAEKVNWYDNALWWIEADQGDLLQAPGGAAVTANNDPVGYVPHHYSGGDFRQTSDTAKPTYQTNIINGNPTLFFNHSASQYLIDQTTLHQLTNTQGVLVIVAKPVTFGRHFFAVADEASDTKYAAFGIDNSWKLWYRRRSIGGGIEDTKSATDLSSNTTYLLEIASDDALLTLRINGAVETLEGVNDGDWFFEVPDRNNAAIGAIISALSTAYYGGHIAAMGMFPTDADFTAEARQALADKYGLTVVNP